MGSSIHRWKHISNCITNFLVKVPIMDKLTNDCINVL